MPDRILVKSQGCDAYGIRLALAEANLLGQKLKCNVVICVLDKKDVASTALGEVIPAHRIKKMARGLSIQLTPIVTATIESVRTIATQKGPTIVVALFAVTEIMNTIDSMPDCKAVIMVPASEKDGENWKEKWSARVMPDN